jgi:hypothetical protein
LRQEELNPKFLKELILKMGDLVDLFGEQVAKEIRKTRSGTVVIKRDNLYEGKIRSISDFFEENGYEFTVRGDKKETHINYNLGGLN